MFALLPGESHAYFGSDTFYENGDHPDLDYINPLRYYMDLIF